MIRLVEDVDAVEPRYREALNLCFPGWGGAEMFDWCFRRRAGAPVADLFVAEEDGRLIAGTATTHRRAYRPGSGEETIGCMTATWTLRAARGRGLFPQMIEESRLQARRRGCALLIAFAGAGKASRPGLLAAGAATIEAAFLTSPTPLPQAQTTLERASIEDSLAAFAARAVDDRVARLVYGADEWRGQMIDRPSPAEAWRLGKGRVAVIEPSVAGDRLLDVSLGGGEPFVGAALEATAISGSAGRRLSVYTLEPEVADALAVRGWERTRAWLYLMSTDGGPVDRDRWWFANGDRM